MKGGGGIIALSTKLSMSYCHFVANHAVGPDGQVSRAIQSFARTKIRFD